MSGKIANATIYKMEDTNTGYFYIGSTFNSLKMRLYGHKSKSKIRPDTRVYKYLNNWDDVNITTLLNFVCEGDKKERKVKRNEVEGLYIDKYINDELCVNTNRPIIDIPMREYGRLQMRKWRANNKEKVKEMASIYYKKSVKNVKCECGTVVNVRYFDEHMKTKKHINKMCIMDE